MNKEFNFKKVSENNMDHLIMEEMLINSDFLHLFTDRAGIVAQDIMSIEHSKTHIAYGESDITVILDTPNGKHGLLIEDKIDAIAMEEQCARYFKRGNIGIEQGDYESFDVFITAPQSYLEENEEAHKYPYHIPYEDYISVLSHQTDALSKFHLAMIEKAIEEKNNSYQVIEDSAVTDFWSAYVQYCQNKYSDLGLISKEEKKGSKANWFTFPTAVKELKILHKSARGHVDIEFRSMGNYAYELENILNDIMPTYDRYGIYVTTIGKSAAYRIDVPILYLSAPFKNANSADITECLDAVRALQNLAKADTKSKLKSFIKMHK